MSNPGCAVLQSTRPQSFGFAFGNPNSIAEVDGVPYFFVSALDQSMQDIEVDPRVSLTLSLAEVNNPNCIFGSIHTAELTILKS